jgi:hypothetical protein
MLGLLAGAQLQRPNSQMLGLNGSYGLCGKSFASRLHLRPKFKLGAPRFSNLQKKAILCELIDRTIYRPKGTHNVSPPKRLKKQEARDALPKELPDTFDKLCEETLYWSAQSLFHIRSSRNWSRMDG